MNKEFEFYHGIVFSKLIHFSKTPITIKRFPTAGNASYILNEGIGLFIKHSSKRLSPWRFSLQKVHQDEILAMKNFPLEVYLILVCGEDGVVTLTFNELKQILNDVHGDTEWISATRNPRKEYTVKGSDGTLGRKVGKSDFPKKIFEAKRKKQTYKLQHYSWSD